MDNVAEYKKSIRRKFLIMASFLLIVIMSFTGFVNYVTFNDNYNNSLISTYAVAGNELVRKIEYALFYGKPIDNYYGMNDTLNELKEVIPEVEQLNITSPSGDILYDLNGFVHDSQLNENLLKTAGFEQGVVNENISYQFYQKKAHVFIKINDNNNQHIANLLMIFPSDNFLQFNSYLTKQLFKYLFLIAFIALLALFIIFFRINIFNQSDLINKKKILIALITVIGLAQLFYSGVNYGLFKNAYIDMAYTSKNFIENIVEKNLESVYSKGLSLQNIDDFEGYLDSINTSLPQIEKISLVQEFNPENAGPSSQINAAIAYDYIGKQMFKILLDMLTVLVISIFFMIELTLLAVIIMTRESKELSSHQPAAINYKTSHGLVRGLTFFISLCTYMSLTFVPIVMNNLYQHMGVLPKDVVLGLPLSTEMLGGILAIILAGWSINKKGWRSIFYLGALFLMTGNLISGLSLSALIYVLSRGIAGLGLGFILMAIRTLVVSLPKSNIAIAQFSAGSIAGLNCGVVIGGMLADRVGYETVFYLTTILVIIPLIFVSRLMSNFEIEARETSNINAWGKFINFIADKKAIVFLFCIFIPFFVSGAFLDYYFPLFASSNDLSQSDISRGFLLNGLFIIYLGPILTKYVTEKLGNKNGLIVSMFIVACALLTFVFFGTVAAAFITLILLGIAESFAISLKTTYFLNLKGIKDLQINEGIAYFSGMVNLSRMAGPMVYGLALSLGMRLGVGLISLGILVLLIVFIFFNKSQRSYSNISEI